MITARQARDISEKCSDYMKKLEKYEKNIEDLIKITAITGQTVAYYEVRRDKDYYSVMNDLKRILLDNNYSVKVNDYSDKFVLKISW